jgi:hypothetical protein
MRIPEQPVAIRKTAVAPPPPAVSEIPVTGCAGHCGFPDSVRSGGAAGGAGAATGGGAGTLAAGAGFGFGCGFGGIGGGVARVGGGLDGRAGGFDTRGLEARADGGRVTRLTDAAGGGVCRAGGAGGVPVTIGSCLLGGAIAGATTTERPPPRSRPGLASGLPSVTGPSECTHSSTPATDAATSSPAHRSQRMDAL